MDWASETNGISPSMFQLSIDKNSIADEDAFKEYISLCDLTIIGEEDNYFILDGDTENIQDFKKYWSFYT